MRRRTYTQGGSRLGYGQRRINVQSSNDYETSLKNAENLVKAGTYNEVVVVGVLATVSVLRDIKVTEAKR